MKTSELADLLYTLDSEDVYIEDENGVTHEIALEERDEIFDGWDTVYPKHIVLKKKDLLTAERHK